jgi:RNAse (barnase) inhibitor barstar
MFRPERSGAYLALAETPALRRAAAREQFEWVELDATAVRDKGRLLEACALSFSFPDWFGSNWDALADCLRDLSWRPARGYVILWRGAGGLADAAPDDFATALEIFRDAASYWKERGRVFIVLLDQPVPGAQVPQWTHP